MASARTASASAKRTGRTKGPARKRARPKTASPKTGARKSRRIKAEKTPSRILPPELAAAIERRIVQFFGLVFVVAAIGISLALLTYQPSDPSWNNATTAAAQNWMGRFGSHAADLILQSVGLSAFCVVAALLVWGIRLLLGKILEAFLWRLILLPAVLVLTAIALSALFPSAQWPVRSGAGGLIGNTLFNAVNELGGALGSGLKGWSIGIVSAALALLFFLPVLGLTLREWGWVGRTITWPFAVIGRLFRRQREKQESRVEPRVAIARDKEPELEGDALDDPLDDGYDEDARSPEPGSGPVVGTTSRAAEKAANKAAKKQSRRKLKKSAAKSEPAEKPPLIRRTRKKAKQDIETPVDRPAVVKERPSKSRTGQRAKAAKQPSLDLDPGAYKFPPLSLLQDAPTGNRTQLDDDALEQDARLLESVLADFGVKGQIVKVRPGPVVTLFELEPAPGIKASRIIGLADDIARSMSAISVRVAVVPGRNVIGIEKPNQTREMVLLRELLSTRLYEKTSHSLALVLGKDIGGAPIIADLARMPHLLIAGTTGSGKSVGINTMILSLLFRLTPEQCKFIMIDPKMLELSVYDGIPQLLTPVVTDPKKAVVALRWAVREMETRYKAMSKLGVRNIDGYNQRLAEARKKGEVLTQKVPVGLDDKGRPILEEQPIPLDPLPYIVVIVDEMADLMLVAGKEIEAAVQRLAQMARAAGIHLIMATQRPSVDVITGTIKANFPTRISFQVTTKIDSRTILGEQGAEQLLGQGDMLHMAGGGRITRVHGPFVADEEVEKIVQHLKTQGEPAYIDKITEDEEDGGLPSLGGDDGGGDELYQKAVEIVLQEEKCSTSFIQRRLQIGYNRAARLVERMEEEGIVSPANHAGKREILAGRH